MLRRGDVILLCVILVSVLSGWQSQAAPTERTPQLLRQVQASFSIAPSSVGTGSTAEVRITAPGSLDLGAVQESQIVFRPSDGISNVRIVSASAQQLTLSFKIDEEAAT